MTFDWRVDEVSPLGSSIIFIDDRRSMSLLSPRVRPTQIEVGRITDAEQESGTFAHRTGTFRTFTGLIGDNRRLTIVSQESGSDHIYKKICPQGSRCSPFKETALPLRPQALAPNRRRDAGRGE